MKILKITILANFFKKLPFFLHYPIFIS